MLHQFLKTIWHLCEHFFPRVAVSEVTWSQLFLADIPNTAGLTLTFKISINSQISPTSFNMIVCRQRYRLMEWWSDAFIRKLLVKFPKANLCQNWFKWHSRDKLSKEFKCLSQTVSIFTTKILATAFSTSVYVARK